MLQGRLPIRRRGDDRCSIATPSRARSGYAPAGVYEDMIPLYGEVAKASTFSFRRCRRGKRPFAKSMSIRQESACAMKAVSRSPDRTDRAEHPRRDARSGTGGKDAGGDPGLGAWRSRPAKPLQPGLRIGVAAGCPRRAHPRRLPAGQDLIETKSGADLTIETLAKEACLSPFHFARAFKAATGMTPHRYVTERRIEKAKFWISEGRRPLAEIAYLCGFSSQASFTKWFGRLVGATPRAYRAGYH